MFTRKPLYSLAASTLLTALLTTGCTKQVHDGVDMKGRVGFGAVVPQSGAYRQLGIEYYRGMKVAEATLNAGGGVEGKKIRIVSYESGGDREKGLDGVRTLTRDFEAPFVAVALPRVVDRVSDTVADSRSVGLRLDGGPLPGETAPDRFLRLFVSGRDEAALMAATLGREKAGKVLILACEDRYGDDAATTLAAALLRAGAAEPDRLPLRRDRESIAALEAALAKTRYAAIRIFAHGPEIPPALYALRKAGVDGATVVGNHAFGGKSVTILDEPLLRGVRFVSPDFGARRDTPASDRFRSEYRSLNGDEPDLIAALGYDQVMVAFTAAKAVETLSAPEIRAKILADKTYEGAAGTYTFDDNGDARLPLVVVPVLPADKPASIGLTAPFPVR